MPSPHSGMAYRLRLGLVRWTFCLLVGLSGFALAAESTRAEAPAPKPRLAVLVVFDQMRGDFLARWEKLFVEGGFRRLMQEGAWFENCHYPYAMTATGPGHASFLTGATPSRHGIVGNDWYERGKGSVYCATSERFRTVREDKIDMKGPGGAPVQMLVSTVGDVLKESTGGQARVIGLSFKDRSAILPAGHKADGSYWLDSETGGFVTSTYYRDRLPDWVVAFNRDRSADRWFGKDWTRLRPDLNYEAYSGPDDVPGEGTGTKQGKTFPHAMTGGLEKPGKAYYDALFNSPFGNDLLLEFTKRAIEANHLGEDDIPDLLSVSFSSNDAIGHTWGPDSQEVLDVTLRSDVLMKEFLEYLDQKVGKGRYVLAVCADHGICPVPEVARSRGLPGVRLNTKPILDGVQKHLSEKFGLKDTKDVKWFESTMNYFLTLNRALLEQHHLDSSRVADAAAEWLRKRPEVLAVYTRAQLTQKLPENDAIGSRVQRTYHPDRCGEVAIVFQPYTLVSTYLTGTNHGTPHPYDTHVPLLVFGPGVNSGRKADEVAPQAIAAIFAQSLGINPPSASEFPVPDRLFEKR